MAAGSGGRLVSVVRPLRPDAVVAYLTDVEGNLDYFRAWIQRSRVVRFASRSSTSSTSATTTNSASSTSATASSTSATTSSSSSSSGDPALPPLEFRTDVALEAAGATAAAPPTYFVFGGDVCDKGVGDLRIAAALTDFKRRHPDRVFLLVGNRDVNKLRFTSELDPEVVAATTAAASGEASAALTDRTYPYWVEAAKRVTPAAFLQTRQLENTRANRLRWMLTETMGADGTFEQRRRELAAVAGSDDAAAITDDAVVDSFVQSVTPEEADPSKAVMRTFLEHGQLAVVLGPHLFVHGAVTPDALGRVPDVDGPLDRVDAWAEALNAWMQRQLREHAARPRWGPGRGHDRGGDALMDYGVPGGFGGAGVVYASNLVNGNAAPIPDAVRTYLAASGVTSVVAGHVPHGDCPTVIRTGQTRVITADTSYSDMKAPDNRGAAVSEVLLLGTGAAVVHGVLADGRAIEYRLPAPDADTSTADDDDDAPDPWVGRLFQDGYFVKARLQADGAYIVCKGQGFRLDVRQVTEADLASRALL